jgi:tRNA(Ile)-lysidine synthase
MTHSLFQAFTAFMQGFPTLRRVAVGLSGGADSWALTILAKNYGLDVTALIIDHRLRPASTAEADSVAATCTRLNIPHAIIAWEHAPLDTAIQEQARAARYDLMAGYCHIQAIPFLMTAHHADDQAETLLLRFAKASDVGGLAGLHPVQILPQGITLVRPLLAQRKQQLVDYVQQAGITFITDPSNENTRFARARLRAAHDVLAAEGFSTENALRISKKMQAADVALAYATQHFILQHSQTTAAGLITLPLAVMHDKPAALIMRALQTLCTLFHDDAAYRLGYDQSERLHDFITAADHKITMNGLVFEKIGEQLMLYREQATCAAPILIPANSTGLWDGRFMIHNQSTTPATIGALGVLGREAINALGPMASWLQQVNPVTARAALPALYQADGISPISLIKKNDSPVWAESLLTARHQKAALKGIVF